MNTLTIYRGSQGGVRGESRDDRRSPGVMAITLALVAVIFLCDSFARGITISVFYAVPLIMLVQAGYPERLRLVTWFLIAAVFVAHFVKSWLFAGGEILDYRIANRALIAIVLGALSVLLECRLIGDWWRHDWELPDHFRRDEDEINETLAICLGAIAMLTIAVADIAFPANYNLAILYLAPLFLCAWIRSRTLLWVVLGLSLVATYAGYVLGPSVIPGLYINLIWINRLLTGVTLTLTTILLHFRSETTAADSLPVQMSTAWRRPGAGIESSAAT